ncbi:MAG TPA: transglutaminase-like domain-containing protein [Ohtaekwangia sp.]|uniref:transglutaminase-like domain-containing protein n=1 Tax=Ohtaekwangia sp. TaxID=2066019 RepID=UPI002F91D3CF
MTENVKNQVLRLILHLIFLILPTAAMVVPALLRIDAALVFVNTDIYTQSVVTLVAITAAYCCYLLRFRFIVTFPIVLLLVYSYSRGMRFFSSNEFDSYYLTVRYLHLSVLFITGWLIGYGLARFRYFPLALAALVLTTGLVDAAGYNKDLQLEDSVRNLFFVILYAFYTYFIRETLENIEQVRWRHFLNAGARLAIFTLLFFLLFHTSIFFLRGEFKDTDRSIREAREQQQEQRDPQEENMLTKNKQQKFDLNQYSQLKSRFGTSKELLFAAYVDNFFPDHPEIPNPLYFTSYHLTKYDVKLERFIRDPKMPSNDLFAPNPSKIPRYFTYADSSVIINSRGPLYRKIVESEIYLAGLSPQTYTAPGTAFSCQPINVDADYKQQYSFAYKTQSYVSQLNSAYFIYNASVGENNVIKEFQESRVQELKKVKDYRAVDKQFYNYYTEVPKGVIFDSIRSLSNRITAGAETPIEKILKVRDYFTSKDETGKPLFKYTLYPGSPNDPNIPNASMLSHFLFKNKKGYCTYFAASTLFMLRSVGIPVRMTTGFMTVDRSDKNKGWYFIYGDQAHAWVEVYFPEYGWLDFDTTIGNDDARESPMPDATPPLKPQKAWFATVGKVTSLEATTQTATIAIKVLLLGDKELGGAGEHSISLNMKDATITKGNFTKKFKDIQVGDSVTAVSYNDAMRSIHAKKNEKLANVLTRLPNPTVVDEVTIHEEQEKPETTVNQATTHEEYTPWWVFVLISLGVVVIIVLLIVLFLARILFRYYNGRAGRSELPEEKAYWIYRASEFLYCQFGFYRNQRTPLEFAQYTIRPALGIGYDEFIQVYHKVKYDKLPADENDIRIMNQYQATYTARVFEKYTFLQRNLKFMNVASTLKFFFN